MNEIKIDKLIRSRRRSIGLQVTPDATLIVRAPFFVTLGEVQEVVNGKRHWIIAKQDMVRARLAGVKKKEFLHGEELFYLGRSYRLDLSSEAKAPWIHEDRICLAHADPLHIKKKLTQWYKAEALKIISERAELYAQKTGIEYASVKISSAKRRWGSCGPSGSLNFNWRLIMAPLFVLDYVVVHEIAHLEIRNHSRHFWNKVFSIMPDYKEAEHWLKGHQASLDF